MSKHNIEVEGLPDGWEIKNAKVCTNVKHLYDGSSVGLTFEVAKKIQPRRIVLEETDEIRTARPDEYYEHMNGITINNSHRDTSGEYRIWREVKEGE